MMYLLLAATGKVGPRSYVLSAEAIRKGDCYATFEPSFSLHANHGDNWT